LGNPPFLELLSYTGYKFVVLCVVVLSYLAFGYIASYIALFLVGALFGVFFF
jgi:tetrahydromethanopterin S-methyltransferase subunit E